MSNAHSCVWACRRTDGQMDIPTNGTYVVIQSNFDTYVTIL